MDLAPSVVRNIILEEHAQIRRKLSRLEELIQKKDFQSLVKMWSEMSHYFLKHIATEEQILRPVLKDIDSWGEVRVDQMNQEHAEQRAELGKINTLIETKTPKEFLPEMQKFILELYRDIESEEDECLDPDVLKDDPITVSSFGG